jgi:xylulokinase
MHLGIDIGTSGVKTVLVDEGGAVLATASAALSVSRPHPGWSEQNPDHWIHAVENTLDGLREKDAAALSAVAGIGLSGQMHGATLLDGRDRPLRPAILWNDTRAAEEAAELDARDCFRDLTGNVVFPGFTAPKLAWVRRHERQVFEETGLVLLPKDYVRLWLSGEAVSDMSDASGTSWLEVGARRWSAELLAATGLTVEHMPRLVEGTEQSGQLRPELARRWRMNPAVRIAGGAGDNAASAIGIGAVAPGSAFLSLGTSGVLFAVIGSFTPNAASAVHTFCHALPATWHQMGVMLAATQSLEWLAGVVGQSAVDLQAALGPDLLPPSRVWFLPYLSGERTPHNDAAIRGAFSGLDLDVDRKALTQAVMEGVAFALRDNLEALAATGTRPARVIAVGGGSRSRYWLQVIATVLGLPVDVPEKGDFGAAFGAARLGMIAATGADPHAACVPPSIVETIEPDLRLGAAFADAYADWRRLYPALKGATA